MNKTRKHYGESAESFKSCYSSVRLGVYMKGDGQTDYFPCAFFVHRVSYLILQVEFKYQQIDLFRTTVKTATELRQSSLRGYDNRRNGVTANIVAGHRQTRLIADARIPMFRCMKHDAPCIGYSSDITIIFLYVELIARAYNDLGLWGDWTRTMVCVLSSCCKTEL